MKELSIGLVSFLFGILANILFGIIASSRAKEKTRKALKQEVQANFYQVRDGRDYSISKKKELMENDNNDPVVINHYDFSFVTYEATITEIPLLGNELALKIHHFYSRLKALQNTAKDGLKLFEESKELDEKKAKIPKNVKAIDATSVSGYFFQILDEYHRLEMQSYTLGDEILKST